MKFVAWIIFNWLNHLKSSLSLSLLSVAAAMMQYWKFGQMQKKKINNAWIVPIALGTWLLCNIKFHRYSLWFVFFFVFVRFICEVPLERIVIQQIICNFVLLLLLFQFFVFFCCFCCCSHVIVSVWQYPNTRLIFCIIYRLNCP